MRLSQPDLGRSVGRNRNLPGAKQQAQVESGFQVETVHTARKRGCTCRKRGKAADGGSGGCGAPGANTASDVSISHTASESWPATASSACGFRLQVRTGECLHAC